VEPQRKTWEPIRVPRKKSCGGEKVQSALSEEKDQGPVKKKNSPTCKKRTLLKKVTSFPTMETNGQQRQRGGEKRMVEMGTDGIGGTSAYAGKGKWGEKRGEGERLRDSKHPQQRRGETPPEKMRDDLHKEGSKGEGKSERSSERDTLSSSK